MRKAGCFFKSIVPFLIAIALQFAVVIPVEVVYIIRHAGENGGGLDGILYSLTASSSDTGLSQTINLVYGIVGLIIFIFWYQKIFVAPFRHKKREYPTGFSFHTIMATIFLAIGLQYVTTLVVNITASFRPDWLSSYSSLMEAAGYSDVSLLLMVYSVVLAPILEETIFRGLIFRYARHALPFWLANIWQALLFGVLHMNMIQGIYAFVMGLFLGFICHRGRGIKYSIPVHIIFNVIGVYFSGLIELSTAFAYTLSMGIGIALTIFGLWLFYTDFTPARHMEDI